MIYHGWEVSQLVHIRNDQIAVVCMIFFEFIMGKRKVKSV